MNLCPQISLHVVKTMRKRQYKVGVVFPKAPGSGFHCCTASTHDLLTVGEEKVIVHPQLYRPRSVFVCVCVGSGVIEFSHQ